MIWATQEVVCKFFHFAQVENLIQNANFEVEEPIP